MSLLKHIVSAIAPKVTGAIGDISAAKAVASSDGGMWDKLVGLADSKGIDVMNVPGLDNAVSIGGIGDAVKKINIGGTNLLARAGDIVVGDNYAKDFVLAHELGHSLTNKESGSLYKKLVQLSRGSDAITKVLPNMMQAAGSKRHKLALLGMDSLAKLPKIIDEVSASSKGKELLKSVGASDDDASKAFSGIGSYFAKDLGTNALLAGITQFLK